MKRTLPILALAATALAFAAAPALAKDKGHCPPGLAKKAIPCVPPGQAKKFYGKNDRPLRDWRDQRDNRDWRDRRDWRDSRDWRDQRDWRDRRDWWADGFRHDGRRFRYIDDWHRFGLPPLRNGQAYFRDGETFLRVDRDTRSILGILSLADLLTGN